MSTDELTILDRLASYARERVEKAKLDISPEEIKERAMALPSGGFSFEEALKKPGISFICECKKASPSKGLIAPDYAYTDIAKEYEAAGADCISVLTEPKWFLGSNDYRNPVPDSGYWLYLIYCCSTGRYSICNVLYKAY